MGANPSNESAETCNRGLAELCYSMGKNEASNSLNDIVNTAGGLVVCMRDSKNHGCYVAGHHDELYRTNEYYKNEYDKYMEKKEKEKKRKRRKKIERNSQGNRGNASYTRS